jgi:cellobiose dehydrogenase (acceptor)
MLGRTLFGALSLLSTVLAQQSVTYTDASGLPFSGVYDSAIDSHFGFLFPTSTTGSEFIGEWIVPLSQKWAGISLGSGMKNNPLVVAWVNNGQVVSTTRFTTYVWMSLLLDRIRNDVLR